MGFLSTLISNPGFFLMYMIAIFSSLTLHELSHGIVAYLLGDDTAKNQGRLSFNPLKHIDLFGVLAMILVGFGWAKPVEIDPRKFRNYKDAMFLTALAGPVSNFLLAIIGILLLAYIPGLAINAPVVATFLIVFINVNFMLGSFNILPIPPLDGYKIFIRILPDKLYDKAIFLEYKASFWIILALIFTGLLSVIWIPVYNFFVTIICNITFTQDFLSLFLR